MLNRTNKAEWLSGWEWAAQQITSSRMSRDCARYNLGLLRRSTLQFTAWQHGYVAALASAVGAL